MGKYKDGIKGSFSGKVGAVIGSSWKGKPYMKSVPLKFHDAKTEGQMLHRAKFSAAVAFSKKLKSFAMKSFVEFAKDKSAYNAVMQYNFRNAFKADESGVETFYDRIMVGRGSLTAAAGVSFSRDGGNVIVSWTDNSGDGSAKSKDIAMMALIDTTNMNVETFENVGRRSDTTGMVETKINPDHEVACYLTFYSEERELASDSVFGMV